MVPLQRVATKEIILFGDTEQLRISHQTLAQQYIHPLQNSEIDIPITIFEYGLQSICKPAVHCIKC